MGHEERVADEGMNKEAWKATAGYSKAPRDAEREIDVLMRRKCEVGCV